MPRVGDLIKYLEPTLTRHIGCDLIDIYPGAGLWSRALHKFLKPRSHILMEPDEELYRPFLKTLLSKKGTSVVPMSGIVWSELNQILNPTYLPHQIELDRNEPDAPRERNDTLLVTANLAFFPKKRFRTFESVAQLVLFQFISSIRASSLFQKYGRVRMLIWAGDDDKGGVLPRSAQRRRRLAVEAELSTEWVTEVCGADQEGMIYIRDRAIDLESGRMALARMEAADVEMPKGRETKLVKEVQKGAKKASAAGSVTPRLVRSYQAELTDLEAKFGPDGKSAGAADKKRLKALQYRAKMDAERGDFALQLLAERDALGEMLKSSADTERKEELAQRIKAWDDTIQAMNKDNRGSFFLQRDNMHLLHQPSPILSWDRRAVEPLVAKPNEFFPNVPCCLLDIQPKAMHPMLRETGPRSSRAGDIFELVLRGIMQHSTEPISRALEGVWPGAAEGVLPNCPSLLDPARGGVPLAEAAPSAGLAVRTLSEAQLVEILDAWMRWPFRPSYPELVGRVSDDSSASEEEDSGAHGSDFIS